jgi:uncharacterized membrane protein YqjE
MSVRPATAAPEPHGLIGALRSMGATVTEILQTRGALFAVELREEIERRKRMLALAAVGFAFLHTALLLATLLVAVVFWDTYRVAAIAAMTVLYLGCGIATLRRLTAQAESSPAPFAATLGELEQDLASVRAPT